MLANVPLRVCMIACMQGPWVHREEADEYMGRMQKLEEQLLEQEKLYQNVLRLKVCVCVCVCVRACVRAFSCMMNITPGQQLREQNSAVPMYVAAQSHKLCTLCACACTRACVCTYSETLTSPEQPNNNKTAI